MKILIVNTFDTVGGAAKATYRLYKALLDKGIDVTMLVQQKKSGDYRIVVPDSKVDKLFSLFYPSIDQLPVRFYRQRTKTLFSPAWIGNGKILKLIEEIDPDIVHLHWVNGGVLKIEDLKKIEKPMVWSLHDMWAFTGGCHYDENCGKFMNRCGACPVLGSQKEYDLSRWIWNRKARTFSGMKHLTINGLSRWLMECSRSSRLLGDKRHINLPNPIDTHLYKPVSKQEARALWNLPQDKKLLLFGAMNVMGDKRKGLKELNNALNLLRLKDIELVIFGSGQPKNPPTFPFKTHYLGQVYDDISLVALYSAVDVTVIPSLQENLSNTIMESLSCATPVVAFDIGGNGDMIEHGINGCLATPFDVENFAEGIEWILRANKEMYEWLCRNARNKIVKEFDCEIVVQKYISLYRECFNG